MCNHKLQYFAIILKARDIFEESIETVTTARDFSLTFDSYAQFEEACIAKRLELSAGGKPSPDGILHVQYMY